MKLSMIFSMMMNPGKAVKNAVGMTKWYISMLVSGFAFGFFFLQTGLDLYKTGQKGAGFVWLTFGMGVGYGLFVIPLIGFVLFFILKIFSSRRTMNETISLICLSYSGALIYGILGLVFSLGFNWKTAIAFGVSGVLWAIGPMIMVIRDLTNGKLGVSVGIVTIVCSFVLLSWSFLGQM